MICTYRPVYWVQKVKHYINQTAGDTAHEYYANVFRNFIKCNFQTPPRFLLIYLINYNISVHLTFIRLKAQLSSTAASKKCQHLVGGLMKTVCECDINPYIYITLNSPNSEHISGLVFSNTASTGCKSNTCLRSKAEKLHVTLTL